MGGGGRRTVAFYPSPHRSAAGSPWRAGLRGEEGDYWDLAYIHLCRPIEVGRVRRDSQKYARVRVCVFVCVHAFVHARGVWMRQQDRLVGIGLARLSPTLSITQIIRSEKWSGRERRVGGGGWCGGVWLVGGRGLYDDGVDG